ncbi:MULTISPECIES: hypothetical protein [Haloarcula]|uniref:hypothetical protein n=1 Tax=Haloarcula TaxID=2237 RepID=UPI0023EE08AB|nr:hypothetical protein [Halomicroarcula sp. XH51]
MIRISPTAARAPAAATGLTVTDEAWQLDPDEVAPFVEATTGFSLSSDLGATECYRIGNRLEGFIEARKRNGEWTSALVESHPDVNSLDEIVALARFFRACHTCSLGEC